MILANKIQKFLQKKLLAKGLTRKIFAQESQIPYPTVNKLINASQLNPELKTIIKIASYFKCSIDKVVGRKGIYIESDNYKFNDISLEVIVLNLRNYINNKLEKNNLNPYKLSREIGFGEHVIIDFTQKDSDKILSSSVIVTLADYFKVSIDEMIGRVLPSSQEPQTLAQDKLNSKEEEKKL